MLYLIKQQGKEESYLKIGYTKDIKERIKAYNTHNANFELIEVIEGEKDIETLAHEILLQFKYKGEWYIENNEIYLIWEICKQESKLRKLEQKLDELEKNCNSLKNSFL